MREFLRHVLAVFKLFSLLLTAQASAAPVDLSDQVWALEDPQGKMTIDDVRAPAQAERFVRKVPAPGYSASAHWFRLTITSPAPREFWLDTANRTLTELDAYIEGPDGKLRHLEAGARFPFSHRPLPTDSFVFPVAVEASRPVTVHLRVRSTSYHPTTMRLSLWLPEEFREHQRSEWMQWSTYLGMAAVLGTLNLMLWLYLRDTNYLRYVLSLLTVAFAICTAGGGYGAGFRLFWPDWPLFEQMSWTGSIALSIIFPYWFISRVLDLPTRSPRLCRITWWVVGTTSTITSTVLIGTILHEHVSTELLQKLYFISTFTYTPATPLMLASTLAIAFQGDRTARFVLMAYLPLVSAAVVANVSVQRGLPMPQVLLMWTSAFELLVMALALADKLYQERRQKMLAKQALVDTLLQSEKELEQKILQRTLELRQEQSRTKELLHNILPIELATELAETGRAAPARHESATVLFTDFAGFTTAAAAMPADRMVSELNDIFAAFDDIADDCGIEKIKTIGDAYMAAAGLPKPCADHAQRCVRAGLRMIAYIEQRNQSSAFKWQLRVGIHSGPVVAGVVGKRKYAFDIWGDTVNIASRMESAGEAGRVNVSAYTNDLAREQFTCEYRGKITAKGKGEVDMYFVVGERTEAPQPQARA